MIADEINITVLFRKEEDTYSGLRSDCWVSYTVEFYRLAQWQMSGSYADRF